MGLRENILNAEDRKVVKADAPEWGDDVYIRLLSGSERQKFSDANDKLKTSADRLALVIATTVCDESGRRAFTEADLEAISEKSAAVIDRVVRQSLEENGLANQSDQDAEEN